MKFRMTAQDRLERYIMCVGLPAPSEIAWSMSIFTSILDRLGPAKILDSTSSTSLCSHRYNGEFFCFAFLNSLALGYKFLGKKVSWRYSFRIHNRIKYPYDKLETRKLICVERSTALPWDVQQVELSSKGMWTMKIGR